MKKIAFVTSSVSPQISSDDRILSQALDVLGIKAIAGAWDDPTVDWSTFDLLLIRSCWNYHLKPQKFEAWINTIVNRKIRMVNPAELMLWNLNKSYLKELKAKGVAIPDSEWISEQDFYADKLYDILDDRKWNLAVLKPCISASSFRTSLITPLAAKEGGKALAKQFPMGGMILQEFMDAIPRSGELSIIFFNGEYSHAVIKEAMPGDFRVQQQFGGTCKPIEVEKAIVQSAKEIVATLPVIPLYARVDGFEADGRFNLMELELIEPVLFFQFVPDAAKSLAACIAQLVK